MSAHVTRGLRLGCILAVWVGCLASGCAPKAALLSPTPTAQPVVIGYSAPELSGGQGVIMAAVKQSVEAQHWQMLTTNANSDSAVQASQIDFLLRQKVKAIVAVPVDSQKICESVQKAREAGVFFYTVDRAPDSCQIDMAVLSNNYLAGQQAGEALVNLLRARYGRPQGTVLELQGNLLQDVAQLRGSGFHAAVDPYPEIRVISQPTDWQPERFASATRAAAQQKLDGIYMQSDCIGTPVVLPILEQLGLKQPRRSADHIFIVGVDGCSETLQAIRDGFADQASSQPITDFGLITRWMEREFAGQPVQAEQVVETGALWSPGVVEQSPVGWRLLLATTSVTADNVDDGRLWGNR